ncbi:Protein kinase of the Mitotic Exit Network, partial [Linderina pennispora]
MENISNFLEAAGKLGLQSTDLFQTVDLYEGKNMPRVIMTLLTIARVVAGIPLNSHRKSVDLTQRSSSDAWNSTATLGMRPVLFSPRDAKNAQKSGPALRSKLDSPQATATAHAKPTVTHVHADSHRMRTDRRRSKRRSATTLFLAETIRPTSAAIGRASNNSRAQTKNVSKNLAIVEPVSGNGQAGRVPSEPQAGGAGRQQPSRKPSGARKERVANLSKTLVRSDVPDPSVLAEPAASEERSSPPPNEDNDQAMDTLTRNPSDAPDMPDKQQPDDTDLPAPVPRPRRRANGGEPQKERLTVYSEAAQRLTNYQLGNCIGRGQFGAVYRALDLETGQMVAVKQISIEGQNADDMEDVMGEVDLLKSLSSPRIVRYHGFVKTDTHLNLVMEYVENGSLSATLKSFGSFPEKLVLAYVVKIIQGLSYLHARDVVHCDLKACNILTTKKGNTKLTDF